MKIFNSYLVVILSLTSCTSCEIPGNQHTDSPNNQSLSSSDSTELLTLVKNVYKWQLTQHKTNGFPLKITMENDTLISGIDWDTYRVEMQKLRLTGYFSEKFFSAHQSIALNIDSSIQQTDKKWRKPNGISIWETNSDDWCNCQDYPDDYWKSITINHFNPSKEVVSFFWTWNNDNDKQYEMSAVKEKGTWKISYIEGFKSYNTVAGYQTIIAGWKE